MFMYEGILLCPAYGLEGHPYSETVVCTTYEYVVLVHAVVWENSTLKKFCRW